MLENLNEENTLTSKENIIEEQNKIIIHVAGEVNKPGIVKLKENARIIDAIEEAGGITNSADIRKINLAYLLSDGQKLYIPNINEKEEKNIIEENSGLEEDKDNLKTSIININTATINELQKLPGIGESMAKKIIEYRNEKGRFTKIEDIKNVNGIGDAKFNNIKDYIKIK